MTTLTGWTLTEAIQAIDSLAKISRTLTDEDRQTIRRALLAIRQTLGLL